MCNQITFYDNYFMLMRVLKRFPVWAVFDLIFVFAEFVGKMFECYKYQCSPVGSWPIHREYLVRLIGTLVNWT